MPATTLTTSSTTTQPPRAWQPPERVAAVLDQIASAPNGHVTLSLFDHDGRESVRTKEDSTEVVDPTAWLRTEVEPIVWWHSDDYTHLRLRVWAPGGVPMGGAKFALPSKDEFGPPPPKLSPPTRSAPRIEHARRVGPGQTVVTAKPATLSAPRTESAARVIVPPTRSRFGSESTPTPPTRTRSGTSSTVARLPPEEPISPTVDEGARADRLERELDVLRDRLEASEQRVEELAAAFDEVVAQRDSALADVLALVHQMNELADSLEAS